MVSKILLDMIRRVDTDRAKAKLQRVCWYTMGLYNIQFDNAWKLFETIYSNKDVIGSNNRKYSNYEKPTRRRIITVARAILTMLSGDDNTNLLNDLLRPMGVAKLYPFNNVMQILYR